MSNFCGNCGEKISKDTKVCSKCGANIEELENEAIINPKYCVSVDALLNNVIENEFKKCNYNGGITKDVKIKKLISTIIFAFLNFIFLSLIAFHFPMIIFIFELANIIVYIVFMKKYNVKKQIVKQIKSRPNENMSNIVASITSSAKKISILDICLPIVINILFIGLSIIIYMNPMIFYEKTDEGYYVRFYTIGITNFTTVTIPENHNGEKVIGIRGNVFANIKYLEEVNLPDTIEVIRGGAFKNCSNLKNIKLPKNLIYLGGSAFKNCYDLESITIPEGVTEINGNTFENCTSLEEVNLHDNITIIHGYAFSLCSSLEYIKLPKNLTEIRGNTFEFCGLLKAIEIPSGVTRIGGHAFYGCRSLSSVTLPDSLQEIGSSAFRQCDSLVSIDVPMNTYINERAFKESPTLINRY